MNPFILFFTTLFAEFIAEMGDKTQFMLIAMASRYKLRNIVLGTLAAILVLNGFAVLAGGLLNQIIPDFAIKLVAAAAFLFFSVTSLMKDDDEEENGNSKLKLEAIAVFCTFFVAELGDKTQLTAITFGATYGLKTALVIWLSCSIGLFMADIIGLIIGYFLKAKTPEGFLNTLAFVIFAVYGFITLYGGLNLIPAAEKAFVMPVCLVTGIIFVVLCVLIKKRV